ncbi:MAG: hypothetical protein FWC46_08085 [Actinomycetia bacterium]|nr:hypothetical protein [Actinomycetes bacterium]
MIAVAAIVVVLGVALAILLPRLSPWHDVTAGWWEPGQGGDTTLSVMVIGDQAGNVRVTIVEQSSTTVRLQAQAKAPSGSSTGLGYPTVVLLTLKQPLGDRQVLNADGSPIMRKPS